MRIASLNKLYVCMYKPEIHMTCYIHNQSVVSVAKKLRRMMVTEYCFEYTAENLCDLEQLLRRHL